MGKTEGASRRESGAEASAYRRGRCCGGTVSGDIARCRHGAMVGEARAW